MMTSVTLPAFGPLTVKSRVVSDCMPRRRARELLKLLRRVDRTLQGNPAVHLTLNPRGGNPLISACWRGSSLENER